MEAEIIAACRDTSWYKQQRKLIRPDMVSSHCWEVLRVLDKYYSSEQKSISTQDLFTLVKLTSTNPSILGLVQEVTPSPALLSAMKERYTFSKVAELALDIVETGRADPEDIRKLLADFFKDSDFAADPDTTGLDELFSSQSIQGYPWPVKFLDEAVGPVEPGTMILFGARPEVGKTSMLANVVSYQAQYTDRPVLVILNEEPLRAAKARYIQSLLNMTRQEIEMDIAGSLAVIQKKLGMEFDDKFKFYHNPSLSIDDVASISERWNPAIIVVDQLRNVQSRGKHGTDVDRLKHLYEHSRRMAAKQQAVFYTVHQARGDAEGVQYISGNQLEGCQTEVQGALDVQIMLGKDNDPMNEHLRYVNIVKNKSRGVRDESKRHGRATIEIDRLRARFK